MKSISRKKYSTSPLRNFGLSCYPLKSWLWLYARQPCNVLNGLNARQSEIFTEFLLKDSLNFIDSIWCFLRNVERLQKFCSFARWRTIRAWAYYKIGMRLKKYTLTSAVRDIYRIETKIGSITSLYSGTKTIFQI